MSKNHWTAYWQTGVLTSLPMDFEENYDGELAAFWEGVLKSCQAPVQILDVCTGNGAIAILLQELSVKLDIEVNITAVDSSAINPNNISKNFPAKQEFIKSIEFIGDCLVETMTDQIRQKFDLIVSQYGIEYCDTKQAAQSVNQMLETDGRLVFVAHSPETDIHKYMRAEESVYQYFDEIDLMHTFRKFGLGKISANAFKNKLLNNLESMQIKYEFRSHDLFKNWVNAAMQLSQLNNAALNAQKEKVQNFFLQYQHARFRAQDMLMVSDKLINNPDWYQEFVKQGLKLKSQGEIHYKGKHNAGHYYDFVAV